MTMSLELETLIRNVFVLMRTPPRQSDKNNIPECEARLGGRSSSIAAMIATAADVSAC
jgi:hypothetical protein